MKRTLGLSLVGLLLMPLPSFAADAASIATQAITNKAKPALSPIKNKKVLDAAKKFNTSGATSGSTSDNSGSNTTTTPETYTIAIESPALIQDPNTCAYTWTIRIRNSGSAPVPDGELTLTAQPIKPDYSNVGLTTTIPVGAIQPGEFFPAGSSFVEKPAGAISLIMGVQKGVVNLGSVNYPFPSVAACNHSE
jgi:hypothetical protein